MTDVVDEYRAERAAFKVQQRYAGVAAYGQVLFVAETDAEDPRQQAQNGHAVTHDNDALPVVRFRDADKLRVGALPDLGVGLRAGRLPLFGVEDEIVHGLRLLVGHVAEKSGLPRADIYLAQGGAQLHGQVVIPRDRGGGQAGAVEVACVQRIDMHRAEALGQRVDLLQAERRHGAVPVPLHHAVEVALGLCVPNKINFRHNCASKILTIRAE